MPPEKWAIFGAPPRQPPFESGQVLVNKKACWRELQLTLWYNAQADYVYHILWGDKDTFNVAWRRLGRDYAMPRQSCGWDTHTILQYGPGGDVLFQHRCQDKFRLPADGFASTCQAFNDNHYNPRLTHEELCFRFLADLREDLRR
jgi:alpha 1,2-mannosyltransferase